MSPLKNTNKSLSDYLPPALVKDWRQCFRSRSSVALFILLELAGWLILACVAADSDQTPASYLENLENMGESFYMLGVWALCLIIPFRAGSTVAADTRVRSSNFLMLTPLSARRIAWGTWSSTALIILLAAVLAIPLLLVRRMMMGTYPHIWQFELSAFNEQGLAVDCLILFWLVIVGWVMAAFYMFSAVLPRVLRVLLLIFCALVAMNVLDSQSLQIMFGVGGEGREDAGIWIPSSGAIALRVVDAILLLVLFLELTRRHYAAPAENCSRSVRLLSLLPLVMFGLLLAANSLWGWLAGYAERQLSFAMCYLFIALLADALLPSYAMPEHAWKLWRGLPAWVQKPGFVSSTLCLVFACFISALPGLLAAWKEQELNLTLFYNALQGCLNMGCSLMLCLLITDCFCRRSAAKRPLVFGVVALVCHLAVLCIRLPLEGMDLWLATLPGGHYPLAEEVLPTACITNGAAFLILLLLLVFWRGRTKNS